MRLHLTRHCFVFSLTIAGNMSPNNGCFIIFDEMTADLTPAEVGERIEFWKRERCHLFEPDACTFVSNFESVPPLWVCRNAHHRQLQHRAHVPHGQAGRQRHARHVRDRHRPQRRVLHVRASRCCVHCRSRLFSNPLFLSFSLSSFAAAPTTAPASLPATSLLRRASTR